MGKELDFKDFNIIACLEENGKQSIYKIAKKTGLPTTTIYNRIKQLEENKVIEKYSIKVDRKKIGRPLCVYILINYDLQEWEKTKKPLEELMKELFAIEGVREVTYTTGKFDMLIKLFIKDIEELNKVVLSKLRKITGVQHTETILALEYKEQ